MAVGLTANFLGARGQEGGADEHKINIGPGRSAVRKKKDRETQI